MFKTFNLCWLDYLKKDMNVCTVISSTQQLLQFEFLIAALMGGGWIQKNPPETWEPQSWYAQFVHNVFISSIISSTDNLVGPAHWGDILPKYWDSFP